jgi:phage terminase large subunit-like protein
MALPKWTTSCPDWQDRITARQSLVPFAPLFADKAADALGVFKSLQVTDLPRKPDGSHPTLGEVCDQFVFDLVAAIFGAEDPDTGHRLIKEFMLLISKKNGKSMIAAGIMVTALIVNWRPNAILQILAPTIEVANNSFEPAMGMVRADPELATILKVIEHQRQIKHLANGSVLKVIAADSDTVAGGKASITLIEELWLFGKKPKSAAMLREALGGGSARSEGFTLYITTHSDEPPTGVFKDKLAYFRDVRDGVVDDPQSLAILFEWPEELLEAEAYLDPEFFYLTNPHMGRSVSREWLEKELGKELMGEGEGLQIFLAKHLNVEIGMRLRRDRWSAADLWLAAEDEELAGLPFTARLDVLFRRCEVVVAGIDGGGRDDLFGFAVIGREKDTGRWLGCAHAWAQRIALERRKQIAPALHGFAADGDLTLVDTGQDLVGAIAALAIKVRDSGLMPGEGGLAVDAWGMGPLVDALVQAGFDPGDENLKRAGHIAAIRQGVGLSSAIYTVEFKLGDGMFRHDGSNLMAWCVSNALVKLRGSALYVDKETSGAGKIDPLVAMLNAAKVMELGPVASAAMIESPYASRGLITV